MTLSRQEVSLYIERASYGEKKKTPQHLLFRKFYVISSHVRRLFELKYCAASQFSS